MTASRPTPASTPPSQALTWDIYCRVIDNLGDAGVCWRLAANLAQQGQRVRLVIDEGAPLAFMAPQGAPGVRVWPWPGPQDEPADVVIEAFGCDLPAGRVAAMAACAVPPVWLNVEYLSAEAYVERSHTLPSPQPNGLRKWFFYPGFTARTGGLLREAGLMAERKAFDREAWLSTLGVPRRPQERVVSLFCYANPALPALLVSLAEQPTLLLVTPGLAQAQLAAHAALDGTQRGCPGGVRTGLRTHALPCLSQADFDRLLWASDLNFVRGEDSLVRALWAGSPLVWQLYPQDDGAHHIKLQAMLAWLQAPPRLAALWCAWNGVPGCAWPGLGAAAGSAACVQAARDHLLLQDDLATQLRGFVASRRAERPDAGC